ncbi:reverse transcriptase domain-containing protein [Tanacetum coccineum]
MSELRRKLFKGTDDEDAHEHVRRVLEIPDLFHFPDVTHDAVMLIVFPITLKGPALRWINRLPVGLITTWDLLEKAFIRQYCPPFKTAKKLEIIRNFKQELDEILYHAWERYNDLLFKCLQHDLNCQQKVHIFYTGLDIPTRRVLDSKGFIPLMTPTQARISIQVMAEHSHNWYDEATTREQINDSPNNVDTKKPKENIHVIQASFKNYEGAHLTMEYPLKKRAKQLSRASNPYRTRETICAIRIPKEIKEDEGDMNDGCDITVEDVERLRKILTPPIHALPNLKPIVQPYMPLGLVYNKEKVVKKEEHDYDILLHKHVMQPLTPQTVHITPPDDDYVASATNPILNKHLNEFREEFADNTRVSEKIDSNHVNNLKELLKTYDFENFIRKLKHQLCQSSHKTGENKVVLWTLCKKSTLAIITWRREQHSWESFANSTLISLFHFLNCFVGRRCCRDNPQTLVAEWGFELRTPAVDAISYLGERPK